MAKKKKQLLILLIALGVVVILLIGMAIWNWYSAKQTAAAESAATIHVTTVTDPVQISFCSGKNTLSFTKKNNSWTVDDNKDFPLDSTYLEKIVTTLSSLTADRKLEIKDKLSAYGLKNPKEWVTVTDKKGNSATLYLGNTTGEDYYAMLKDGKNIYTISSDLATNIGYDLYGMAKLDTFPALSESNIKTVTINGKLKSKLTVQEAASDDSSGDSSADSSATSSTADTSASSSAAGTSGSESKEYNWFLSGEVDVTKEAYLTALRTEIDSITFTKLADFQPSQKDLKGYGLTNPNATLTVSYLDSNNKNQKVTLLIGNKYTDSDGTKYYYAALKGSEDQVYLIKADGLKQILASAKKGYAKAAATYKETDTTTDTSSTATSTADTSSTTDTATTTD